MKTLKLRNSLSAVTIALMSLISFTACQKDANDGTGGGGTASTSIKVTDAPIDDASVTGAFVTIADIQLDGKSVQGFTKTTVDLNAYRNGTTKAIGTFNLEGKTYSSITFVLDYDMDANGASPGSYVVTTGGVKHKLESTGSSITISKSLTLSAGASNSLVADFDLRKMIIHQSGTGGDNYDFATAAELQSSVRVVAESNSSTISGKLNNSVAGTGKVIAYVYKKGTFNRTTEMQAQGTSGIQFKNAVSSAEVDVNGNYQLHFLESGDYEVHFANYTDLNADGKFELSGTLVVTGTILDLLNLSLSAGITLTVDATATAILP